MRTRLSYASLPLLAALIGGLALSGCNVGPRYARASVPAPPAYKELTPESFKETDGWKTAQPQEGVLRGKWWEMFQDPELNALEEQVDVSNQNINSYEAQFQQARALILENRASLYPSATTAPTAQRSRASSTEALSTAGKQINITSNNYSLPLNISWEADIWGRVRNTVLGYTYSAQASAADWENARLSARANLALAYFQLRGQDTLAQLYQETIESYQQALELTRARYETGIDSDESVAQAESTLKDAQAQATNLGIVRAQQEHAIALLVGQPASAFSVPVKPLQARPPAIPFGVPSDILQRRPDVAAAERDMAAANAAIGAAKAAFFPSISLTGELGYQTAHISQWLNWPSRVWALGPSVSQTIFNAGAIRAAVTEAKAVQEQQTAQYRQTVLTAFQQVEDALASLRILSREIQQQDEAVRASGRYLTLAEDRYKSGIDPYLNVLSAQTTVLADRQTAANLRIQQILASVQLVEALGGGWDAAQLPSPQQLVSK
jgi:NodT family efflux transporter outer membrane factor (OMF) lipoprotein